MAGRKRDLVWTHFTLINENKAANPPTTAKAQCNICGYQLSPLVSRMKSHYEKCSKTEISLNNNDA